MVVAAVETGGRWDEEGYRFLVQLAFAKARQAPGVLQRSLVQAWLRRWTGMLAYAIHDALAASLLDEVPSFSMGTDGGAPVQGEVLTDGF